MMKIIKSKKLKNIKSLIKIMKNKQYNLTKKKIIKIIETIQKISAKI